MLNLSLFLSPFLLINPSIPVCLSRSVLLCLSVFLPAYLFAFLPVSVCVLLSVCLHAYTNGRLYAKLWRYSVLRTCLPWLLFMRNQVYGCVCIYIYMATFPQHVKKQMKLGNAMKHSKKTCTIYIYISLALSLPIYLYISLSLSLCTLYSSDRFNVGNAQQGSACVHCIHCMRMQFHM